MQIMFINNFGGGFADYVNVEPGTSVEQFFHRNMGEARAEDYLIRVNRMPVSRDHVLQEGDRITITPTKVEGAHITVIVSGTGGRR